MGASEDKNLLDGLDGIFQERLSGQNQDSSNRIDIVIFTS